MKENYPRMANFPSPGFAAGPCLYKDTLQLASHYKNNFSLGHASLNINEGFIFTIIEKIKKYKKYNDLNVGLLGMSFKPNIDDTRVSLSYKLKKHLKFIVKNVYTHDPHVTTDKELKNLNFVLKNSDIVVICIPHDYYKNIKFNHKKIIDIWGI
jgi:UDP-N-acetyl-D-mannosaminuronic acid dehydrogenase